MKTILVFTLLLVFGLFFMAGCPGTNTNTNNTSNTVATGDTCGNNMCIGGETCSNCPADCLACPTSGKEQLISFVNEKWDKCHYKSDCEAHGTTITFNASDAITNVELARILDMEPDNVIFLCGDMPKFEPELMPPTELGCNGRADDSEESIEKITPTATAEAYVQVECSDDYLWCRIEFQKA